LDGWSGAHGDGHYHRTHGGVSSHPTAGPCPIHVRDGTAHLRCGSQLLAYSAGPGHISDDARCYSDHLADRCVRRSSSVRLGNESTRRGTSVERPGVTCTSADSLSRSAARPTTNAPSGDEPTAPSTPANRTSTGHFRLLSLKLQIVSSPSKRAPKPGRTRVRASVGGGRTGDPEDWLRAGSSGCRQRRRSMDLVLRPGPRRQEPLRMPDI
jgi:hypothetical protein